MVIINGSSDDGTIMMSNEYDINDDDDINDGT